MLGGSLTAALLEALPPLVVDFLDLDELLVAELDEQLFWATRQGAALVYGDVVGEMFEDSIRATWSVLYPPSYPA